MVMTDPSYSGPSVRSTVFARWHQCAPHRIQGFPCPNESVLIWHLNRFIRFCRTQPCAQHVLKSKADLTVAHVRNVQCWCVCNCETQNAQCFIKLRVSNQVSNYYLPCNLVALCVMLQCNGEISSLIKLSKICWSRTFASKSIGTWWSSRLKCHANIAYTCTDKKYKTGDTCFATL